MKIFVAVKDWWKENMVPGAVILGIGERDNNFLMKLTKAPKKGSDETTFEGELLADTYASDDLDDLSDEQYRKWKAGEFKVVRKITLSINDGDNVFLVNGGYEKYTKPGSKVNREKLSYDMFKDTQFAWGADADEWDDDEDEDGDEDDGNYVYEDKDAGEPNPNLPKEEERRSKRSTEAWSACAHKDETELLEMKKSGGEYAKYAGEVLDDYYNYKRAGGIRKGDVILVVDNKSRGALLEVTKVKDSGDSFFKLITVEVKFKEMNIPYDLQWIRGLRGDNEGEYKEEFYLGKSFKVFNVYKVLHGAEEDQKILKKDKLRVSDFNKNDLKRVL